MVLETAARFRGSPRKAGVVLEGVLLRADVVVGAEGWRHQLNGRPNRLVSREEINLKSL